jgi:hypothetical protein
VLVLFGEVFDIELPLFALQFELGALVVHLGLYLVKLGINLVHYHLKVFDNFEVAFKFRVDGASLGLGHPELVL